MPIGAGLGLLTHEHSVVTCFRARSGCPVPEQVLARVVQLVEEPLSSQTQLDRLWTVTLDAGRRYLVIAGDK